MGGARKVTLQNRSSYESTSPGARKDMSERKSRLGDFPDRTTEENHEKFISILVQAQDVLDLYSNPPAFQAFVDHHAEALIRLVDRVLAKNQSKKRKPAKSVTRASMMMEESEIEQPA